MIHEHRRNHGQAHAARITDQEVHVVASHIARDGAALLAIVRQQLAQGARIHHRAGDAVGADPRRFLEHHDRDLGQRRARCAGGDRPVVLFDQVGEVDRARESGRARSHELDVEFEDLSLHESPRISSASPQLPPPRRRSPLRAPRIPASAPRRSPPCTRCPRRSPPGGTRSRPRRPRRTRRAP